MTDGRASSAAIRRPRGGARVRGLTRRAWFGGAGRASLHVAVATVMVVSVAVAACAPGTGGRPSPSATQGPVLSTTELKLRLVDRLGTRWYCDPDVYPLAREDEASAMRERWPEVVKDTAVVGAILAHEKLPADPSVLDDGQRLVVYQTWKALASMALDPAGGGRYRFDYLARPAAGADQGTRTTGTIDERGAISVASQGAAPAPMCPICLARGTRIDTPEGPIAVEALRLGTLVWTLDASGARVPGAVSRLGSMPVPAGHRVIRLVLADGRTVTASAAHPLADGRRLGMLHVGDAVDGSVVAAADSIAYGADRTFDLVVDGATGIYLSDGIALASTLR